MTRTVTSADGTVIAFDQLGAGPPVVMVGAAFNDGSGMAPLSGALAAHFTVFNDDRRGRRDSGDTAAYSVERQIEDLGALIAQAGGSTAVFGYSSGATLALRAAAPRPGGRQAGALRAAVPRRRQPSAAPGDLPG
jgi:pimeloyl-ACP methyl ester carboxylesterase